MQISKKEMELLVALKNNPISSKNKIGKALGITSNTVNSHIKNLKARGVLRKNKTIIDPLFGKREHSEVFAYVNPYSLGLTRIFVLIKEVKSYIHFSLICNYLDKHPYTVYRAMVMGFGINIYVEFQIPFSEMDLLLIFLDNMKLNKLFQDFIYIVPSEFHRSDLNLNYMDPYCPYWNVDIYQKHKNSSKSIESAFNSFTKEAITDFEKVQEPSTEIKINEFELNLMRELTINAKPNISLLSSIYNKDRTTISRNLNKIKEKYISHYNIAYNKSAFHLGNEMFLFGKLNKNSQFALKKTIKSNLIPYIVKYAENGKQFFLRIDAPSNFVNDLTRILLVNSQSLNQYSLHKKTNIRYFFYPKNYDVKNKCWKGGEEYIVNNPLR